MASENPDDILSRYLLSKSQFSPENKRVKYSAFMPAPNRETSVFIITDLQEREIWDLGENHVASPLSKKLYGRADIYANHVKENDLDVRVDDNPHRHANIINWPNETSEQKIIAMQLASKAELILKN